MRNIKLLIEYEGTNYSGWQTQKNAIGIQEVIENSIERVTGERVKLIGSGRTDGRVHAQGQVANFLTNSTIPGDSFKFPLNMALPRDIKVLDSEEMPRDFHSRFDVKGKRYRYVIYNGRMPRPIYRNFSYHVIKNLNIEEMKKALPYFIGTHDFESFMASKSEVDTTIRTIYSMDIIEKDEFIEIIVEGKSFLRHMVRIIVGTLVYIGTGKFKKEDVEKIIEGKKRQLAGPTAPAQGLFLEKVYYD